MIRLKRNLIPSTQSSGASQADHYQHHPLRAGRGGCFNCTKCGPLYVTFKQLQSQVSGGHTRKGGDNEQKFQQKQGKPSSTLSLPPETLTPRQHVFVIFKARAKSWKCIVNVLGPWIVSANSLSKMQGFGNRRKKSGQSKQAECGLQLLPGNDSEGTFCPSFV